MLREFTHETYYERFHLFVRDMEEFLNGFKKRLKDQEKGLVVTDLCRLCSQNPKQFSDGTIIRNGSLRYTQNHIPDCNYCQMAGKRIP